MSPELNKMGVLSRELGLIYDDGATTVAYGMRTLNFKGRLRYRVMVKRALYTLNRFYAKALREGVCYYGPFKGEFGHFLLHNLPFLMHLHQRGVAIHYCGMELHKPFLKDEQGRSIISKWYPLRDFFPEVAPIANATIPPADVQGAIDAFTAEAKASGLPFLDIGDHNLYWFVFRNWQLEGKQHKYNLGKLYARKKTHTCVIFPRKKGGSDTPNNGGPWDYMKVARAVAPFYERVYLVGHPSLSGGVRNEGNIELKISASNEDTLRYCAEAELIITQHSGAVHVGAWVDVPVLLIYNGNPPIKGLLDTIRFRLNIANSPLNYAFSSDEIVNFVATLAPDEGRLPLPDTTESRE